MSTSLSFSDQMRRRFSQAMAAMYCEEVPDYETVVDLVKKVNADQLANDPNGASFDLDNLTEERHGAIRVGTAQELSTIRRLFAVLGMDPVGYYDLSVAAIPVHSTAFRPITADAIAACPFRVFTSLLRLDLIDNRVLRETAQNVLSKRQIFSDRLLQLLARYEETGSLNEEDAASFIAELVIVFKWREEANVSSDLYQQLHDTHRLIADVVSFKGPHINHLTPRTLDIDIVQDEMPKVGLNPKAIIEGPPRRQVPILLRQTAFKALEEKVNFQCKEGAMVEGAHTARFGEIEQRGAALTQKGQQLYDHLLTQARQNVLPRADGSNAADYYAALETAFQDFPDDVLSLYDQGLIYVTYHLTEKGQQERPTLTADSVRQAIADGLVTIQPITYEDFLPVSAAGIFQSNLGDAQGQHFDENANQAVFEQDLGAPVTDLFAHYAQIESESLATI